MILQNQFKRLIQDVYSTHNFDALAEFVMNDICLVAGTRSYRIVECEMYLHKADHLDEYTHKSVEQLKAANWYFNGFGLDITFGNLELNAFGGILIREIRSIEDTPRYISGPSKLLKEIFNQFGNVFDQKINFHLEECSYSNTIYCKTPRIGLSEKPKGEKDFINREYRYITEIIKEHKFNNKEKIVRELVNIGKIAPENMKDILGYNVNPNK